MVQENDYLKIGVDRLKFSVSSWHIRDRSFFNSHECTGKAHGFDWYNCGLYTAGFSDDYAVFEFGAMFFILLCSGGLDVMNGVEAELSKVLYAYEKPKITRIDLFLDYLGKEVKEFSSSSYTGRYAVKFSPVVYNNRVETSYFFPVTKAWMIRRYDKTQEIKDKELYHRYDDVYLNGVIRCEFEFNKSCLSNLKERDYNSVLNYIANFLFGCNFHEAEALSSCIQEYLELRPVEYKASSAGELNGQRTRERILKRLDVLLAEYASVSQGDITDFINYFNHLKA